MKESLKIDLIVVSICLIIFSVIASNLVVLEDATMDILVELQSYRSKTTDILLKLCSFCGFEFFFIFIPIVCFYGNPSFAKEEGGGEEGEDKSNKKKIKKINFFNHLGLELMIMLIYTWFTLSIIKSYFSRPRPYQVNSSIVVNPRKVAANKEFSFPSGHSCGSASCWLYIWYKCTLTCKKKVSNSVALTGIIITFLASFSRLYFGVHYIHDVFCGWVVAVVFFITFKRFGTKISTMLISFVLMLLLAYSQTADIHLEQKGLIMCPGSIFGILICLPIIEILPSMSPLSNKIEKRGKWRKILRTVLGILGIVFLGSFEAHVEQYFIGHFFYGFAFVSWVLIFSPFLFKLIKLS
eukprot:TRINITY_DN2162_c0_g1_i1.p1 TRINITY_DN2162_c0_g1~~TRINITY_DN2162_c0_g1_i1.p1  ORF type:complete len:353 (-),score=51.07 TRINITY_DN2162_c0_g1_i1:48-1106(-)